jgi:hypothetical protein
MQLKLYLFSFLLFSISGVICWVGFSKSLIVGSKAVEELNKYFLPLQQKDVYYKDARCRNSYRFWEAKKLKKYKANFGKKIWVKSWKYRDFLHKKSMFGDIRKQMKFKISAVEISKKVSPFINREIKKMLKSGSLKEKKWQKWLRKFEEWGRTYFDLRHMGKIKNDFYVIDGSNGNCICLNGKMFFVEESKQKIIDLLFKCPYLLKKSHREKKNNLL